jgi:5-formyltetrahydrofolate cyclo-ligase
MTQAAAQLKNHWRAIYKAKRKALTESQRQQMQNALDQHFYAIPLQNIQVVHLYLPIGRLIEVDTYTYWAWLKKKNPQIRIALSVSDFQTGEMQLVDGDTIESIEDSEWGIPEPIKGKAIAFEEVDLLLMPLLAVDQTGQRLGYGKGFYDRMLQKMRPEVVKIGVSWFEPQLESLPSEPWDKSIDACISPAGIHWF